MKARAIHGWLEATNKTPADGIEATGIPSSTFYRFLEDEKECGHVRSLSTENLEKLINNSDELLKAEDFLDLKPTKKSKGKVA